MLIEKTTLIEFDEAAERKRILTVFEGVTQKKMLAVLDAFVAGEWDAFVQNATGLPREMVEYLAEPVFEVAKDLRERAQRREAYTAGYAMDAQLRSLLSLTKGIAGGPESAQYPKYSLFTTAN
jgi:hypothetical protein